MTEFRGSIGRRSSERLEGREVPLTVNFGGPQIGTARIQGVDAEGNFMVHGTIDGDVSFDRATVQQIAQTLRSGVRSIYSELPLDVSLEFGSSVPGSEPL